MFIDTLGGIVEGMAFQQTVLTLQDHLETMKTTHLFPTDHIIYSYKIN